MADDQSHFDATRSREDRNTAIARIPRLDWHPWVHLAVIVDELPICIDDESSIPRHAEWVLFHDGKASPDPLLFACRLECGNLGSVESTHDLVVRAHTQAVDAVLRKYDHVHLWVASPSLFDQTNDMFESMLELVRRADIEELRLAKTYDDGVRERFIQSA